MKSDKMTDNYGKSTVGKIITGTLILALMVGLFFLQKVIPKLPFEHPAFYCKRVTEVPLVSTADAYNKCMRENSGPSDEVMRYVRKQYGSELNDKQEICMGEAIERYLSGNNLKKFLDGTPAIKLISQDKTIDLASDMLKCAGNDRG